MKRVCKFVLSQMQAVLKLVSAQLEEINLLFCICTRLRNYGKHGTFYEVSFYMSSSGEFTFNRGRQSCSDRDNGLRFPMPSICTLLYRQGKQGMLKSFDKSADVVRREV